ncbi:FKBP-type peptidyl-prolyl cis-trans isomerase SlyD [Dyadobacter sp. CECT 9623]|jgi:FKBP-type peptidyl-prolyl cis-trans isomerase SlyD|uniref:Peptidyl-prolyl cis-trans isomerase n=1 Tax=Dyadobacter linearis TaxID=2823330 RepID=A0ABM8UNY1_9BACT|nr:MULTISPECIES: FKBP-type peptidyl-prolyl cis-trans isomerase [unclassified Dyadobacter]MCE7060398.1 FKBP-type peptidyl-prolyl cis-trans isomerase [Dyadobacter sp. CY343]CAG5069138.1 FKBP-type peptidyl-prolyl cis-trans isomerase SlyD [Dyadobacter sp. CECT 9623]
MKVEKNNVVALTYNLQIPDSDGEMDVVEVVNETDPMYFIHGISGLPEGFENQIEGLSAGDTFDFTVEAEEGYGEYDEEAIVELPKAVFQMEDVNQDELLQIGNIIPMTNEDGERMHGQVVEIKGDLVVMNFNHPLAGKDMHFSGQILSVREATPEEISHGHVHGAGGVHHH